VSGGRAPVLVLSSWWPRESNPHATPFIVDHAAALAVAAGDVECWSIEPGLRTLPDRPLAANLPIVRKRVKLPWRAILSPAGPRALFLAGVVAGRRLRVRPALIMAQALEHAGPYAAGLATSCGAALAYLEHWSGVAQGTITPAQRSALRLVLDRSDVVLAAGGFLGRAIEQAGDLDPESVVRMDNPVDLRLFRPGPPPTTQGTVIVQVADFRPAKGHDLFADALLAARPDVERHQVRFVLVGDGPERARIERRLADAGLGPLVHFTGKLSRAEVAQAIRDADWTLLTSETENLPCAAIESLAIGRPVAAPQVGGIPEVVEAADGVLFERTAEGLADTLRRIGSGSVVGLRPWHERATAAAKRYGAEAVANRYASVLPLARAEA